MRTGRTSSSSISFTLRSGALSVGVFAMLTSGLAQGAQSPLELGSEAIQGRRYREAITHLEAAPDSSEALYLLGAAYWGEDRPYPISADKAIAALRPGS